MTIFLNDLTGDHASADNKKISVGYIVYRIDNDGATQAGIIAEITQLLSAFPAADVNWGAAALAYNTGKAARIAGNLLGDLVTADIKTEAINFLLAQ